MHVNNQLELLAYKSEILWLKLPQSWCSFTLLRSPFFSFCSLKVDVCAAVSGVGIPSSVGKQPCTMYQSESTESGTLFNISLAFLPVKPPLCYTDLCWEQKQEGEWKQKSGRQTQAVESTLFPLSWYALRKNTPSVSHYITRNGNHLYMCRH